MKELIKISEQNGKRAVSARELHAYLESKERFSKWIERMFTYGFEKTKDYTSYKNVHPQNLQQIIDYALTIDTAKEIAMIQRTSKGKQARQYFIAMENFARSKINRKQYQQTSKNAISEKRSELVDVIRNYLRWGDMTKVSKKLGIQIGYIKKVMLYKNFNTEQADKVTRELYEIALRNKKELLFNYDQMIKSLKQ
ncbi:antA/AntB antirepressor family protein [Tenacibaculum maritimum]|nr:antA/AntB antirepressor family protein [Tenacibaculum maritimum]